MTVRLLLLAVFLTTAHPAWSDTKSQSAAPTVREQRAVGRDSIARSIVNRNGRSDPSGTAAAGARKRSFFARLFGRDDKPTAAAPARPQSPAAKERPTFVQAIRNAFKGNPNELVPIPAAAQANKEQPNSGPGNVQPDTAYHTMFATSGTPDPEHFTLSPRMPAAGTSNAATEHSIKVDDVDGDQSIKLASAGNVEPSCSATAMASGGAELSAKPEAADATIKPGEPAADSLANEESSIHEPDLLPNKLAIIERQISDRREQVVQPEADVAEAELVSDSMAHAAIASPFGNRQASFSSPIVHAPASSATKLFALMPAPAMNLPAECYLALPLLAVAAGMLLFSRPLQNSMDQSSAAATFSPGFPFWPTPMHGAVPGGNSQATNRPGATAGTITATVGLAILAVGLAALVRSHWLGQLSLRRPGLIVAAAGQGILLMGLAAQAVYRVRPALQQVPHHPPLTASVWPTILPIVPVSTGYPWAMLTPQAPNVASQPGQIAQIKAQLASLSQQVDQLGNPPSTGQPTGDA